MQSKEDLYLKNFQNGKMLAESIAQLPDREKYIFTQRRLSENPPTLEDLGKQFHAISIDLRGHGRSTHSSNGHTMGSYARDLRAFMKEKNLVTDIKNEGKIRLTSKLFMRIMQVTIITTGLTLIIIYWIVGLYHYLNSCNIF